MNMTWGKLNMTWGKEPLCRTVATKTVFPSPGVQGERDAWEGELSTQGTGDSALQCGRETYAVRERNKI